MGQQFARLQASQGLTMGQNHGSSWQEGGERPRYSGRWLSQQCTMLDVKGDAIEYTVLAVVVRMDDGDRGVST